MATYCIGDIHGCHDELMRLLELIKFDENKDDLILTGDLIGRGPLPVETMQEILKLGKCVKSVLGNHDINFLAVHYGISKARAKDNLEVILKSKLREEIVEFFLKSSLLQLHDTKALAVAHAGIFPLWDIKQARKESKEIQRVFRDPVRRLILLRNMYSEEPRNYDLSNNGLARWRFALNAFTRMRLCYKDCSLDYKNSAVNPDLVTNQGLTPWFKLSQPIVYKNKPYKLVFGHWAALNAKCNVTNIRALDTGCVWGDRLTAWRFEDDHFFSVKSVGYASIQQAKLKLVLTHQHASLRTSAYACLLLWAKVKALAHKAQTSKRS